LLKAEFHVPISPTPEFLIRIHLLAASLDANSGLSPSEYRLVVTAGAAQREDLEARCPWSRQYPLEWRWVDPGLFERESYFATVGERLRYRHEAAAVVLLDADVFVRKPIRDWIESLPTEGAIQGVTDFYSPFYYPPFRDAQPRRRHREWWRDVFQAAGVGPPSFVCEHRGWGMLHPENPDPEWRFSPYYLNYGVVGAPPNLLNRIGEAYYEDLAAAARVLDSPFKAQIALSLAVARLGIPGRELPLEYNFPNMVEIGAARAAELERARFVHYLHPPEIDKVEDFQSYGHLEMLSERSGMARVNQAAAEEIRALYRDRIRRDLTGMGIVSIARPPIDRMAVEWLLRNAREDVDAQRFPQAYRRLSRVMEHARHNAGAHYMMAYTMQALNRDSAAALRHYDETLRLGYASFWVLYNRGSLYLKVGDRRRAMDDLEAATRLNPEHEGARSQLEQARLLEGHIVR
jgi:tetratricopeptide (TPR) repeat protein